MKASEILTAKYNEFNDKFEVTILSGIIQRIESEMEYKDEEGYGEGIYNSTIYSAINDKLTSKFIDNRLASPQVKELCSYIIKSATYKIV